MAALLLNQEQLQFDLYMANVLGIVQPDIRGALRAQGLGTINDFTNGERHRRCL
jgi:hypothetical protein